MTGSGEFDARVRELFDAASELAPHERPAFLAARCAGDARLRREVDSLLDMAESDTGFLETPPMPIARGARATPERIGPYRVLDTLGRGGMGVVYRARDERDGRLVALKSLLIDDTAVVAAIRREIQALSRLAHPGIVRILDTGLHEGVPWYAMELLIGRSLATAARELVQRTRGASDFFGGSGVVATLAETVGTPVAAVAALPPAGGGALPALMALVAELSEPLAHIHGEGLVHRDVKPGNVVVTDDGRVVLLDFGLTTFHPATQAREVLQTVGLGVGTATYMAPEQARGELVDARADIYALGCVAYELVTGQPPLVGATARATLERRQLEAPEHPSTFVTGVPDRLAALLAEMLAPLPQERLGHADDVRARLAELGLVAAAAPPSHGSGYLYRPRLVGRDELVRTLVARFDEARSGRGGMVLLGGETGIGKTRVAMALAERARRDGAWVASGDGAATADATPLRVLVRRIADSCREGGAQVTGRVLAPFGRALSLVCPEVADLPGFDELPPMTAPRGPDAQLLLAVAITDALRAIATQAPVLVLVDDLQLADETLVSWLSYVARTGRFDDARVLVLATHRREEQHGAVDALRSAAGVTVLEAPPLDDGAVAAMAADMLARTPPAELVAALATAADGNPLFVAEYLRTAVEGGLLARDPTVGWHVVANADPAGLSGLATPRALEQLVARHVTLLPPQTRELLAAAAVTGRVVDERVLAAAATLAEADRLDALQTLIARAFLEPRPDGTLRFRHDGTRKVVYDALPDAERRERHAASARAMTITGVEPSEHLARHHRLGGDEAVAGATYLEAARRCAGRFELEAAGRCYEAALELAGAAGLDARTVARELVDDVLAPLGRLPDAARILEASLAEPWPDRPARGRALLTLSSLRRLLDDPAAARGFGEEALALFRDLDDRAEQARALAELALVHARAADLDEADVVAQAAIALSGHALDPRRKGEILILVGSHLWRRGRLPAARRLYEQSVEAFSAAGDPRPQATALANLGGVEAAMGEHASAAVHLAQSIDLLRRVSDRNSLGAALMNLGSLRLEQERFDEALALYEEATPVLRDTGDRVREALARGNMGTLLTRAGRAAEARPCFTTAARIHEEIGDPRGAGVALSNLAECVHLAGGDITEAMELSRRALEMLRDHGAPTDLAMALCRDGHLRLARGEPARPVLDEIERLLAEAEIAPTGQLAAMIALLESATP